MEVILSKKFYGYCPGLKRSLEIADNLWRQAKVAKKKIYFDVPLAHNEIVKKGLESKGFCQIDVNESISGRGNLFLISAHGASPDKINLLKQRGFKVKSATCPKVTRLQQLVTESHRGGSQVLIFGDKEHPEIIGVNGCAGESAIILKSIEEAEKIRLIKKTVVLSQTTFPLKKFKELAAILKKNNPKIELSVKQTICPIVEGRILEICELAEKEKPDLSVVVGSTLSNNTKLLNARLSEINQTIMVGNESELNPVDFLGKNKILVAAGTSTPPEVIKRVAAKLKSLNK